MKATFDISERLLLRLGKVAERRGTTVSALVEAGIFQILSEDRAMMKAKMDAEGNPLSAEELMARLPTWNSGGELVDITNKEELYRVMDEYDGFRYV